MNCKLPKLILVSMALTLLSLFSCEEDKDFIALSENIKLSLINNNENVEARWSLAKLPQFTEYRLIRSLDKNDYKNSGGYYQSSQVVYTSNNFYDHQHIDMQASKLGMNYYWVEARCSHPCGYEQVVKSNIDSINIGNYTAFNSFPRSVIHNSDEDLLGFIDDSGQFTLYNYTLKKIIGKIDVSYNDCYPAFGKFGNNWELYIPAPNGMIRIYDAPSMTLKETIQINNYQYIYCIVPDNEGRLYVNCRGEGDIYKVDRATGISTFFIEKYGYENFHMSLSPHSKRLIHKEDESYSRIYSYQINDNGDYAATSNSYYYSGYSYPASIPESFSGIVYILPEPKALISHSMTAWNVNLPAAQDIAFKDNQNYKYLAPFNAQYIIEYDAYDKQRHIDTPGYPIYVFSDENKLIVLFSDKNTNYDEAEYNVHTKGYSTNTPFGIAVINVN